MTSKYISRRLLLRCLSVTTIALFATTTQAGDFRYEPRTESSWPKNIIRAIQMQLNESGIDAGQADGLYGPNTKKAIMEFQRSKNLKVDGQISNELIRELELGR